MSINRQQAVTLEAVALRAGVHSSTVSRALNPATTRRVSPSTVNRIRRIAQELGYEPNPWARSLRINKTHLIGLVIPRLTESVVATMFEAAEEGARRNGYQAITVSTQDDPGEQDRLVRTLLDRRVDGLVIATCRVEDRLPDRLEAEGVPFVLMNRGTGEHVSVRADDERGGYLAAEHLLDLGHRRIGMIAGPLDTLPTIQRLEGYRRAHAAAGMSVDDQLVVQSRIDMDSGAAGADQLLSLMEPPTAIFAINDVVAMGAMWVALQRGLRVPQDLAIVGYNDLPMSARLPIPVTSVAVPLADMGQYAVNVLVARMSGQSHASHVLPVRLRVRASSVQQ